MGHYKALYKRFVYFTLQLESYVQSLREGKTTQWRVQLARVCSNHSSLVLCVITITDCPPCTWLLIIINPEFLLAAARIFSGLPQHVISTPSLLVFWWRLKVKVHLYGAAFRDCIPLLLPVRNVTLLVGHINCLYYCYCHRQSEIWLVVRLVISYWSLMNRDRSFCEKKILWILHGILLNSTTHCDKLPLILQ